MILKDNVKIRLNENKEIEVVQVIKGKHLEDVIKFQETYERIKDTVSKKMKEQHSLEIALADFIKENKEKLV